MLHVHIEKELKYFQMKVNFDVNDGLAVLFGESGAGKTTLLHMIAGLTSPDRGEIILNERALYKQNKSNVKTQKRNVGYVFQDYALFPHMTVEKNLRYGIKKEEDLQQLRGILETLGINHLLQEYPSTISGGEKQRVALARALASKPDALLMDEPFASLDEKNRQQCHEEILRLKKEWNIPMILVTHDRKEAEKLGDQLFFLEKGQLIEG
ncbi:ATP-binding cassette domain-containing protein [Thalassobacillus hwangdonensis]|uniref:ATP-binding cassette domain-containing protein n=1 Tax=Thalassobacillus hwangdonensis TaxID=546108 RepID=A0ABW3KV36_9BACI